MSDPKKADEKKEEQPAKMHFVLEVQDSVLGQAAPLGQANPVTTQKEANNG